METKKRGLCAFDDKRFLLEDGFNTIAFGHYMLQQIESELDDETEYLDEIIRTEKKRDLGRTPHYEHGLEEDPLNWEMAFYYDEFDSDDEMNYV